MCLGKHQRLLVERSRTVKVWRNEWVVRRTDFHFVVSNCERFAAGKRDSPSRDALLRPRRGLFLSLGRVWVWDRPPPAAPAPTPAARGFSSLSCPFRGGARASLGVSMTTLCVGGGSAAGVARERAVPGRSFINVTHIMILSAASY